MSDFCSLHQFPSPSWYWIETLQAVQEKPPSLSDGHIERKGIWELLFLSTDWEGAWMAFRRRHCHVEARMEL